jgi:ammonia channel protein AmtB
MDMNLISHTQVFMMVLGLSFLYCGTVDRRLSLQMAWLPLMTAALVGAQVVVLELVDTQ